MAQITADDVRKIARLGGLHLSDEALQKYQKQFEDLLQHFESLNSAGVEGVQPLYHAVDENIFRDDDEPADALPRATLLENAPDHDEVHFRLGRILGAVE